MPGMTAPQYEPPQYELGKSSPRAAMVNLLTNGAMNRIDQQGKRACELYQWGLHPHHAEPGSPLAADNAAFEKAYPLAPAGGTGVTKESLFR